jgi:hypothetical protein
VFGAGVPEILKQRGISCACENYYHHDGVLTFARDPDFARVRWRKPEHPPDFDPR